MRHRKYKKETSHEKFKIITFQYIFTDINIYLSYSEKYFRDNMDDGR